MESDNPADWEEARKSYFEPLNQDYPGHPYQKQVQEYLQRTEDHDALQRALASGQSAAATVSEAQRFYQEGLRLCQAGDAAAARRLWQNVIQSFREVESEQRWVRLAEKGMAELQKRSPAGEHRWTAVREALQRARQLRDRGQRKEAEEIWNGIKELYRNDPSAASVLAELRRDQGP